MRFRSSSSSPWAVNEREGIVEQVNKSGEFVGRFGMTKFRLVKIFYA